MQQASLILQKAQFAPISLLWAVKGGRLIELHRDWAVIEIPVQARQRTFHRRNVDPAKITLPWLKQPDGKARPRPSGTPKGLGAFIKVYDRIDEILSWPIVPDKDHPPVFSDDGSCH